MSGIPVRALATICLLILGGASPAPDGYIRTDLFPEPVPKSRDTFSQRVQLLRAAGRYEEALGFARTVVEEQGESAHPLRADVMRTTVRILEGVVALPHAERRRLTVADSLAVHVVLAWHEGHYAEGTDLCRRVLDLRRAVLGPDHPDVARSLHDLGTFHVSCGRRDLAEPVLREALAMRRRVLGPKHYLVAETLHWLGELLFETGRYGEAEAILIEAVEVRRAAGTIDDEELDRDLLEIAQVHMQRGNLPFAESLIRQALTRTRAHRGEHYWLTATLLENLARIAEQRGDLDAALPLRHQALEIRRAVLGPEHPHVARSLTELGILLLRMERFAEAEARLREALAANRRFRGPESPEAAAGLKALGNLHEATGERRDAERLYREALALDRRQLGERNADVASDLLALARVHRLQGDLKGAAAPMTESLAIYRESLGERHPALAAAWYEQALLHVGRHAYSEAESCLTASAQVFETARVKVGDGYARASFSRSPYEALAAVRLLLGRGERAWDAAERSRGRVLADLLWASGADTATAKPLPHGRALLDEPVGKAYTVCTQAQVQAALDERTAVIGMLEALPGDGEHGPWGYVIRRDAPLAWVDLAPASNHTDPPQGEKSITVGEFQEELALASIWPFRVTSTERIDAEAQFLWRRWFGPLATHLAGIDRLVVIPSGPLSAAPLEALMDPAGRRLVDAFSISYVPSATIFVALREHASRRRAAPHDVLIVGDPASAVASPESLAHLPGTRREIEAMTRLFPKATVLAGDSATEETLHRLAAAQRLLAFDVIHFATHAFADDQHPDDSGLFLSRPDLPDSLGIPHAGAWIFDGVLTAGEIVREWRLGGGLVTLSSCSTARGKPTSGEGYVGLAHAFLRAGARSLVVSLWPVEDEATSLLMSRFYENLRRRGDGGPADRAAALQDAKRWLASYRDAAGERPYRHPAYWSAFILTGES